MTPFGKHRTTPQMSTPEKEAENLLSHVLNAVINQEKCPQDPSIRPFTGTVFSVGGYVRDSILGIQSKDLDIVVEMPDGAKRFTEALHNLFPAQTSRPLALGAGYPIYHLSFKGDIHYQGKVFKTKDAEVDFADSQYESFPDPNTRQRITTFGGIADDIRRRDFTCNMLMRNISTGLLVDLASSEGDIHRGILRGHPKVPLDKTFSDDPLRMIRLIRFQCKFGWHIPFSVLKAVKRNAPRIQIVSGERIYGELIKIISYGNLHRAIRLMDTTGLLPYVFPEVTALKGVHGKDHHAEGDAYVHTLIVTQNAKPTLIDQMAALLHDIGKVQTRKQDGEKIRFHGHEPLSAEMTDVVLRRLKFDLDSITTIKKVISFHLRACNYTEWSGKAVRKFIRDCGDELDSILNLMEADVLGCFKPDGKHHDNYVPILKEMIKKANEVPITKEPVLDGQEIMDILKISPGPLIGKYMKELRELDDEYAVTYFRKPTKDEARAYLLTL